MKHLESVRAFLFGRDGTKGLLVRSAFFSLLIWLAEKVGTALEAGTPVGEALRGDARAGLLLALAALGVTVAAPSKKP